MGSNGRSLAEREFDQNILSARYLSVIEATRS